MDIQENLDKNLPCPLSAISPLVVSCFATRQVCTILPTRIYSTGLDQEVFQSTEAMVMFDLAEQEFAEISVLSVVS